MAVKFSNNAKTTLSSGITSSATSIAVVDASAWPTLGSGDHTLCTLAEAGDADALEIVKVTAISGNTLTVVRAQEGTTARSFSTADKAELRITAGIIEEAFSYAETDTLNTVTGRGATTTNAVTVGNLTSTGIDDNATSTAITIDSDERVGINITPTTRALEVKSIANAQIIASFKTGSGITGRIAIADANTTADNSVGIGSTGNNLDFYAGAAAKATLSATGNLSVTGNLTSLGIDDNATSTAITIDASENVGIGGAPSVNSGYTTVTLNGATNGAALEWETAGVRDGLIYQNGDSDLVIQSESGKDLVFNSSGSNERMRIDSSGDATFSGTVTAGGFNTSGTVNAGSDPWSTTAGGVRVYGTGAVYTGVSGGTSDVWRGYQGAGITSSISSAGAATFSGTVTATGGSSTNWNTAYADTSTATSLFTANKIAKRDSNGSCMFNDLYVDRNDGTGVIYFQNDGSRYLYYNSSSYTFNGAPILASTGTSQFGGLTATGLITGRNNTSTVFNSSNDTGSISIRGDSTHPAVMTFHCASTYAVNFGLDGTNMKLGGWSAGATKFLWNMANGDFHANGNVTAYSTTVSDERLKDDVQLITSALDTVDSLRGVTYTWNAGSRKGKRDYGVIAQEVEQVIPEIVHETTMPLINGDEETIYKTVDYEKLCAVLINAVSELRAEVEALKNGSSD